MTVFTGCIGSTAGTNPSTKSAGSTNLPGMPAITTNPASQTAPAGQTATFSVVAGGTAPLSYQWYKGAAQISGATSASYTTPPTTVADNGTTFRVYVFNSVGNTTSSDATLTVTATAVGPSITTPPASATVNAGQAATFSVVVSGTAPLSYQWNKNGAAISGATSSSYTTPATSAGDNGALFSVTVSNSAGSVTSNNAILTVNVPPSIITQPASQTVTAGQTATFSAAANGTTPLSYQWQKNGTAISGATSSSYTTPATTASDNGALFSVVVSSPSGNVTSNNATLTVNGPPSISTQPVSQTVTVGQTATFSVVAGGTTPFSYQWNRNGVAISGATSSSYTTPATTAADNGVLFSTTVTNSVGNVTSNNATLTVTATPVAPSITTQPANQTVNGGQTASFSVTASGTSPLSYQWLKNGSAIAGAASSSYTTPATIAADNGALFSVTISNSVGNVTSSNATLTVNAPPSITTQPANQTVNPGQTATFTVVASGTAPLSYQWKRNGAAISGATSTSYTTPVTTAADNGALFSVTVSNSVSNVTSNNATLTVNIRTLTAPASLPFGNVTVGGNSILSLTLTNSGNANVTISNVSISGAGFSASGVSTGQVIPPGQNATLNVTFAPAAIGSVPGANVTIASDATNSPAIIPLTGTGVQSHSATLAWTASTSIVVGYNIYRSTASGGPYTKQNSAIIVPLTYTDTTVLSGRQYFYVVRAVDSNNVESINSNEVPATIP